MDNKIGRRDFLKATPAAAALAYSIQTTETDRVQPKPAPRISSEPYTPAEYPIRAKRFSEVAMKDDFWAPKIKRNAEVTIPFEMQKAGAGRGLNRNVLEAAIYSLQTHPDAALQAQVDGRIQALLDATSDSQGLPGNSGFEVAVAQFQATGKRDLLNNAIKAADVLYEDFKMHNPPFSGGEHDATKCLQLKRATGNEKPLDLAKHYLDIRGLENSVNRSRQNQSYRPVLEQTEAVGHAVNAVTLMVSLADVGMLTGLRPY